MDIISKKTERKNNQIFKDNIIDNTIEGNFKDNQISKTINLKFDPNKISYLNDLTVDSYSEHYS